MNKELKDSKKSKDSEYGAIFAEFSIPSVDGLSIGLEYVPFEAKIRLDRKESGTGATVDQYKTLYVQYMAAAGSGSVYGKIGYSEVDAVTNEKLATGGSYGNATLEGYVIGLGYNRDLDSGAFVRVEANYMDFDGVTLTNTADSTKSVSADGFDGYGARISVGKSF